MKQNGTQSYKATIKCTVAKDGKADLNNLVATKELTVNLNGYKSLNEMKSKMPAASQDKMMPNKEQDKTMNASQPMATPSMKQDQVAATSSKMSDEGKMASNNKVSSPMTADQMKDQKRHASIYR